jgi:hypothetical protein
MLMQVRKKFYDFRTFMLKDALKNYNFQMDCFLIWFSR